MWATAPFNAAEIGQKLGLVEAVGGAFGGEPVLSEEGVRFVAVFFPEGEGHGLRLATGDANEAVNIALGDKDTVAAPTAWLGLGATAFNHVPDIPGLRGQRQVEADVDAPKRAMD